MKDIRVIVRPILLIMLVIGSFIFIIQGIGSANADWWVKLTLAACGEWVLERPLLKIAGKA